MKRGGSDGGGRKWWARGLVESEGGGRDGECGGRERWGVRGEGDMGSNGGGEGWGVMEAGWWRVRGEGVVVESKGEGSGME